MSTSRYLGAVFVLAKFSMHNGSHMDAQIQ